MHNMMIFHTHAAVAINLIALVAGVFLFNKACATDFFCQKTGKIVGGLVAVIALLSLLCIGYLSLKNCCHKDDKMPGMWHHPAFEMPERGPEEIPTKKK